MSSVMPFMCDLVSDVQRIRDLSLLPHILNTNRCWMDLYFGEVASPSLS